MKVLITILNLLAFLVMLFYALILTQALLETGIDRNWNLIFQNNPEWIHAAFPVVILSFILTFAIPLYFYLRAKRQESEAYFLVFKRSFLTVASCYLLLLLLKLVIWRERVKPFGDIHPEERFEKIGLSFLQWPGLDTFFLSSWPAGQVMIFVALWTALRKYLMSGFEKWFLILWTMISAFAFSTGFNWLSDVMAAIILGFLMGQYFRDWKMNVH